MGTWASVSPSEHSWSGSLYLGSGVEGSGGRGGRCTLSSRRLGVLLALPPPWPGPDHSPNVLAAEMARGSTAPWAESGWNPLTRAAQRRHVTGPRRRQPSALLMESHLHLLWSSSSEATEVQEGWEGSAARDAACAWAYVCWHSSTCVDGGASVGTGALRQTRGRDVRLSPPTALPRILCAQPHQTFYLLAKLRNVTSLC